MDSFIHCSRKRILAAVLASLPAAAAPARADVAYAWGNNDFGEVGDGTTTNRLAPVAVNTLSGGVTAVAAGRYHSLAIQNGGVYAWGANNQGQLGDGTLVNRLAPVAVNLLTSGVTAISGGEFHSVAIQNGAVYAWGYNADGELGNGTSTYSATPVAVSTLSSGVTAIAAGQYHNLAILNGGVYVWGYNSNGQLGDGTTTSRFTPEALTGTLSSGVTAVAGGQIHSLAIQNGGVYAWGANNDGQLGDGTMNYRLTPVAVSTLSSGVTAIAGGVGHSLALRSGYVYAWGDNTNGQLGVGMGSHSTPVPVDPTDLYNITAISAGADSSYALSSDGSIWDWGANNIGQLGLGNTTTAAFTPQHLLPLSGYVFTSIASSNDADHAVATLAAAPAITVAAGSIYHFIANPNTGILTQPLSSLTINANGKAIADVAAKSANRQLLKVYGGLTLSGSISNWTSLLDLGNNDADLRSSTLATVTDQVRQGYAGGKLNGSGGIISSAAAADPKHLLAIGVIQNNQSGTPIYTTSNPFDGTAPGPQDILLKSTYYGDANLDGKVDASDYSRIDAAFLADKINPAAATGWFNGDFNYDGVVNGSDYTLMDNAFNTQGALIAAEIATPTAQLAGATDATAVPETGSMCFVLLGGALSHRTRRRSASGIQSA